MPAVTTRPASLAAVELRRRPFARIREDLAPGAWPRLEQACEEGRALLDGRTVWSINSTALGGGVAEMQRTLVPYWRAASIDARWLVMNAPRDFFRFTKRVHNLLHGRAVPRPGLRDRALFDRAGQEVAAEAVALVAPGDVVVLQDPQTAALVAPLRRAGARVVWRCHVGADTVTAPVEAAWRFLLPYVEDADAFVFTRRAFVPEGLPAERDAALAGDRPAVREEPAARAGRRARAPRPLGARARGSCGSPRRRARALGPAQGPARDAAGVRPARR